MDKSKTRGPGTMNMFQLVAQEYLVVGDVNEDVAQIPSVQWRGERLPIRIFVCFYLKAVSFERQKKNIIHALPMREQSSPRPNSNSDWYG